MKSIAMPAAFAEKLTHKILYRPANQTTGGSNTTPVARRPHLWAASEFWQPGGAVPCPMTVQGYDLDSSSFVDSHQSVTLLKNGAQFLMTAEVSLRLYDANIGQVDYTHQISIWGGLQQCGIYFQSTSGNRRIVASAYSPMDAMTNSSPPEKILSFTTYIEAWRDNEELKLYANAGYSSPIAHPVKLWARLIRLHIIRL
jgi:hypothetical protein